MNDGPAVPPVLALIGNTPTIPLRFEPEGLTLFAKCEFLNPSGSVKDRFAAEVLTDARRRGALQPDTLIVECTSGNTGIALAMVGAAMGCRVRILMGSSATVATLLCDRAERHFSTRLFQSEAAGAARHHDSAPVA